MFSKVEKNEGTWNGWIQGVVFDGKNDNMSEGVKRSIRGKGVI